jgi:hypothetical protein
MKKPAYEQGLKDLQREFGVVTQAGKTGPAMRDVDTARGALCYVPRNPINHVMAFSDEPGKSPARAKFGAGKVKTTAKDQTGPGFPESQIPGSREIVP